LKPDGEVEKSGGEKTARGSNQKSRIDVSLGGQNLLAKKGGVASGEKGKRTRKDGAKTTG